MKKAVTALTALTLLSGCADHPDKIQAQYISPLQYDSYSCKQLSAEMRRVSAKVSEVGGLQEKAASNSDTQMGVGLILLWPTLFFLDSHSAQAAEYAKLKGEFDALEQAGIQKNCGLKIERPKLPEPEHNNDVAPTHTSGARNR